MELRSPVFKEGRPIPVLYTKDGDDMSPPLVWGGVPDGAESLVLIMEDPDAPGGTFTHWLLYNLPASMPGIDREVPRGDHYGAHALQGVNDFGEHGYGGPKPPGGTHRYVFRLLALDSYLPLESGTNKALVMEAMKGHILEEAQLTGTYERKDRRTIARELAKERRKEDAYDRAAHYSQNYPETYFSPPENKGRSAS